MTDPAAKRASPEPDLPIRVGFISLGCAKNRVDSQVLADALLSAGMKLAPTPEEADVILVNTCAFIDEAREESLEMIRDACRRKREGVCRAVVVAGCLPQRYRERIRRMVPQVDAFLGLDNLGEVADVVRRVLSGERGVLCVGERAERLFEPGQPGVVFSTGPYAYLKVAEGCYHHCAFCAIPLIRGRYRSRSIESLVREGERLLDRGFRELNLISQDVTSYGRDLGAEASLPALLKALGGIGGDFWIRLLYGYPSRVTEELLDAMGSVPQVCAYLDLPVQHSHPDILRGMGRADSIDVVRTLAGRLRTAIPDLALRTTCLLGFPGETDAHVEHLLAYLRESEFDHVGAFVFSPEEGTRAAELPDRPSRREAERRRNAVMQLQEGIVRRRHAALVGREARVLLEQRVPAHESLWAGRSPRQAPEVDGVTQVAHTPPDAVPGQILSMRYESVDGYDLRAVAARRGLWGGVEGVGKGAG